MFSLGLSSDNADKCYLLLPGRRVSLVANLNKSRETDLSSGCAVVSPTQYRLKPSGSAPEFYRVPNLKSKERRVAVVARNRNYSSPRPLRANIDETVLPVVITEQGENRNQCEEQRNFLGFSHGFACR